MIVTQEWIDTSFASRVGYDCHGRTRMLSAKPVVLDKVHAYL